MLRNIFNLLSPIRVKSTSATMKVDKVAPIYDCSLHDSVYKAVQCLQEGHVIAVPTDTIYGLACSANCPDAIKKLYEIKGRDAAKPVAICVSSILAVRKWGNAQHLPDSLLKKLLPGPVTIVLEKTPNLDNPYLNPHADKIGIRIPKHDFINNITRISNLPIALTSANFSNEPSTLCVKEFEPLYNNLGAVFDGGVLSRGLECSRTGSTVVDLSVNGKFRIIRKGISLLDIVRVLNEYGLKCME